jgi:DNA-binding transcriptional regulator GbsR (MarR family)
MTQGGYVLPRVGAQVQHPNVQLARWEAVAVDAVGNVIEFWGFKRNQGRVWALLYLRAEPLNAQQIEGELRLSKGGVSMLLRDLERWGVVLRVREPGSAAWQFRAETDLFRMVARVIEEREQGFVARVRADLAEARRLAQHARVSGEKLARLDKMNALASASEQAIKLFLKTARLDLGGMLATLRERRRHG